MNMQLNDIIAALPKQFYAERTDVTVAGRTFWINIEHDEDHGAPWEESDCHGVVSDWTQRNKRSSELVLNVGGPTKRFYDVAASIKLARKDGWGLREDHIAELQQKLGRTPTQKEMEAEAVRRDYEYLRGWCTGDWHWVYIVVNLLDEDGEPVESESIYGIASSDNELITYYAATYIAEMLESRKAKDADRQPRKAYVKENDGKYDICTEVDGVTCVMATSVYSGEAATIAEWYADYIKGVYVSA